MRFILGMVPGASRRRQAAREKHLRASPASVAEQPPRPPLPTQGTLPIAMLFSNEQKSSGTSSSSKKSIREGEDTTDELNEMHDARLSSSPSHTRSPTNTYNSGAPLLDVSFGRPISSASTRASIYSDASSLAEAPGDEDRSADQAEAGSDKGDEVIEMNEIRPDSKETTLHDDESVKAEGQVAEQEVSAEPVEACPEGAEASQTGVAK